MSQQMRDRVADRLKELGLGPSSGETKQRLLREGLSVGYLSDFMSGKTNQMRVGKLEAVARVLECSVEFLTGETVVDLGGAEIDGVCQANAFRQSSPLVSMSVKVQPEPDYPWNRQLAFLVKGDDFERFSVPDGAIILALRGSKFAFGDLVVAKFSKPSGETETTIMTCKDQKTFLKPSTDGVVMVNSGFEAVGKIIKVYPSF